MLSVREYFDASPKGLVAGVEWNVDDSTLKKRVVVTGKLAYMTEEHAKYWSYYIPANSELRVAEFILNLRDTREGTIDEEKKFKHVIRYLDSPEEFNVAECKFTGRVYLYFDQVITLADQLHLTDMGNSLGLDVRIRDRKFVDERATLTTPLAFISHDSRDKDLLVRDLAHELQSLLCPVWYDEYSLKVGDSLRENIERGIKEAKKCILILSPNFLANGGWTKREFETIYSREVFEKKNFILPVWHGVDKAAIYDYSPLLTDRVALSSSIGAKELAKKLAAAIRVV